VPSQETPRYKKADLLDAAQTQSTPATGRLITDWVSLGLLDKPAARSLGRGKGVERIWPENQRKLFLVLLNKRREVRHIAALCNIPVMLWLYWGVEYVPVRQVRRALKTYNRPLLATSARAARQNAQRVIAQLGAPNMKRQDRTDLVNAIVAATGGAGFRRDVLLDPAQRIFDPDDQGRRLGPRGARLRAESWVNVIEAKVLAAQVLGDLDDDLFEHARLQHHAVMAHYIERQPGFAQDPGVGAMFPSPTLDWFANEACDQITTTIGFLELARHQGGAGHSRQRHKYHKLGPRLRVVGVVCSHPEDGLRPLLGRPWL
jgi:hypothetical protein